MTFSDYREQYDLSVKVRSLAMAAGELSESIKTRLTPLAEKRDKGERLTKRENSIYNSLSGLEKMLFTDGGPYPQPMLNDQISYLYSMITSTDQKPGKDAYTRYNDMLKKQVEIKEEYDRLNN